MGTTTQKLQKVLTSKNAIKTAIKNKTGVDPGDKMSTYASKINNLTIKTDAPMRVTSNGYYFQGNDMEWEAYPLSTIQADQSDMFSGDECITYLNLGGYLKGVKPTRLDGMFASSYIYSFDFGNVDLSQIGYKGFQNMFCDSQLTEVNFITNENKAPIDSNYEYMFQGTYLDSFSMENLDFGDANMQYFLYYNIYMTTLNFKNITFGSNTESYFPTLDCMFKDCHTLTSVNFDNVHIYNATAKEMFYNCKTLTTLDFSKCYFSVTPDSTIDVDSMFSSCSKLTSLTILDNLNNFSFADANKPFDSIKTNGNFYYDPYWYTEDSPVEDTKFYQSLPSTWKKVALTYNITKNKSLSIAPVAEQIVNQFATTVDIVYQLNTDGKISSRVITDRIMSGVAQVSCTKNTTGKDRTVTLSYTKNGLTAKTTVVQKYLTPTFDIDDSSWKTSTSTLVTGTYKYECYGGGEDVDSVAYYMYVTIPAGINGIKFDVHTDCEYADFLQILEYDYTRSDVIYESGESHTSAEIYFDDLIGDEWDRTQPMTFEISYHKDGSVTEGADTVYFGLTFIS